MWRPRRISRWTSAGILLTPTLAGRIPVLLDGIDEDPLGPDDLPFHADEQGASEESSETLLRQAARGEMTLRELEDRYVDLTLERSGGNKVQAARILGLDRKTLYRWALRREAQQS